jgi:hypothetical protein
MHASTKKYTVSKGGVGCFGLVLEGEWKKFAQFQPCELFFMGSRMLEVAMIRNDCARLMLSAVRRRHRNLSKKSAVDSALVAGPDCDVRNFIMAGTHRKF